MDSTKILVVDDNPTIRRGLSVRLQANGYEVLFAEDAISATAALVTERPDLVILDLGLPAGDGFVVMERLHKNDRLANIPVIALQAGAAAFFQKPVEDSTLLFAIRKALDVSRGELRFDD
jgi:DNA-binding response OmpR family regulator